MNARPLKEDEIQDLAKHLYKLDFFSGFKRSDFNRLVNCFQVETFENGDVVFKHGDVGKKFYIIKSGQVEIHKKKFIIGPQKLVATLKQGECFGEMALVSHEPRNATVVSVDQTETYSMENSDFKSLFEKNVSFKEALKKIAATRA